MSESTILILIVLMAVVGLRWEYGVPFMIFVTFTPLMVSILFEWMDDNDGP